MVALGILAAIVSILVSAAFRDLGYKAGHKEGFQEGWQEGWGAASAINECWWMRAEAEVNGVREKIWREEAQL